MGPNQHFLSAKRRQLIVVNHLQSFLVETVHFGIIMHYIAQAIKCARARQLFLGGADSFHHAETESSIIVNLYFQIVFLF